MAAILDFLDFLLGRAVYNEKRDPKNMGGAVGISLLSFLEAEITPGSGWTALTYNYTLGTRV